MYRKYLNKDGLEIWMPDDILHSIKKNIIKFYPNECGGIFAGKITDNRAVIEKMMMPVRFKSNPILFTRAASFLNKWLVKVFKSSNGNVHYIGEWHSHPNSVPVPSIIDLNTMRSIAMNKDVKIRTPILLIVGYNSKQFQERFYILFNNKLITYDSYE